MPDNAAMLPPACSWSPHAGGHALRVNGELAALCAPLESGRWRVELRVNRLGQRAVFQPGEDRARAYVEAWATKWAEQLLELYPRAPHGSR